MYTEFYGLKEKPFNLTPSPRFIYMSEGHKEAMALLTYGITERKGFILLTGEVGTGKTTMIHNLINNLDNSVEYVYIVNPLLSPQEFIDYLAFSSFEKRIHFKSKADFLLEFEDFLKTCFQHQKTFILIIDEAHKLSFELLEEIRLLSNMEFAEEKLINIFLVGQPELNENLNSPRGRATLQRISIRYDIPPLGLKETGEYLQKRLIVAGSSKTEEIFEKDAIAAIYKYSQGYPRTINILADNALLLGYSRNKKKINSSIIKESYNSMRLDGSFLIENAKQKPIKEKVRASDILSSNTIRWLLVSSLIIIIAFILFLFMTSSITIPEFFTFFHNKKTNETISESLSIENSKSVTEYAIHSKTLTDLSIFPFQRDAGFSETILAKEGDTLSSLAARVYGTSGEEELDLLKRYNPDIKNIDKIDVGQKIFFPVYTILIESYGSFEKADRLYQQLKKDGFDANIISLKSDNDVKSFQVTLGAFKSKKEAEEFASNNLEGRPFDMPKP